MRAMEETTRTEGEEVEEEVGSVVIVIGKFPADAAARGADSSLDSERCCVVDVTEAES